MHRAVGDKFALGRKFLRQTVEDEIEFSSPAMVTSNQGMLRFGWRLVVVKQDYTAEITRRVGVETFLQSRMQSQKLANEKIWSQASVFRNIQPQFDH